MLSIVILACSNGQEPIFHLFDHSTSYPSYDEVSYLKSLGFKEARIGGTLWLTKSDSMVDLKFVVPKNEAYGETCFNKNGEV